MCVFVKQKTEYEMRISDWSSDVCSSDLLFLDDRTAEGDRGVERGKARGLPVLVVGDQAVVLQVVVDRAVELVATGLGDHLRHQARAAGVLGGDAAGQH